MRTVYSCTFQCDYPPRHLSSLLPGIGTYNWQLEETPTGCTITGQDTDGTELRIFKEDSRYSLEVVFDTSDSRECAERFEYFQRMLLPTIGARDVQSEN
jgi:hypothetical protein